MNRFIYSLCQEYIIHYDGPKNSNRGEHAIDVGIAGAMLATIPVLFTMLVTHRVNSPVGYVAMVEFVLALFMMYIR